MGASHRTLPRYARRETACLCNDREPRQMVERVVVLLGTVQFRLKVKADVSESATLANAEKAAQATLA